MLLAPVLHHCFFIQLLLESEDKMIKELSYTFDENDDLADVIDAILTAPGIRIRYRKDGPENWISIIEDQDMEDGLSPLPPLEKDIIEGFFLQQKSLLDISEDLSLEPDLLLGHLRAIRARLVLYV